MDVNAKTRSGGTALIIAATNDNVDIVNTLLAHGADANATDELGWTALIWATVVGHANVVKALLAHHAVNVNAGAHDGWTALMMTADKGLADIAEALLAHGADLNVKNNGGGTPLRVAAQNGFADVVKVFMSHGAKVNETGKSGVTALMMAATGGHIDVVQALLAHGANVNARDDEGYTALRWAARKGHADVVQALLAHDANVNAKDNKGATAISDAANADVAVLLLTHGADAKIKNNSGITPLMVATQNGHADVVEILLSHGDDPNAKCEGDWTALMAAADTGHADIAQVLLAQGADTNTKNRAGRTALILAAEGDHADAVPLLIAHGADVNAKDNWGETALIRTATNGHVKVVKMLLALGANASLKSDDGKTAANKACGYWTDKHPCPKKEILDALAQAEKGSGQLRPEERPLSDVDTPSFNLAPNPTNFAVVIGVEKYASLPSAEYAARDAEAIRAHLTALGYPSRNIFFLGDQQATRAKFAQALNTWLPERVGKNSTVFFYFSGHGSPDIKTNQTYLVGTDGDPEDLESTAYPVKMLYGKLGGLKAKQVIVALDSCFSGAGGRSVLPKGTRPLVSKIDMGTVPEKLVVLTASDKDQISGTLDEQGHGTFTYYLLKGLDGGARDNSGAVTVRTLFDYLVPKVQDAARLHHRDQTPQLLPADSVGARIRLR